MKLLNRKLTVWIIVASFFAPFIVAGCGSSAPEDSAATLKNDEMKAPPVAKVKGSHRPGVRNEDQ